MKKTQSGALNGSHKEALISLENRWASWRAWGAPTSRRHKGYIKCKVISFFDIDLAYKRTYWYEGGSHTSRIFCRKRR